VHAPRVSNNESSLNLDFPLTSLTPFNRLFHLASYTNAETGLMGNLRFRGFSGRQRLVLPEGIGFVAIVSRPQAAALALPPHRRSRSRACTALTQLWRHRLKARPMAEERRPLPEDRLHLLRRHNRCWGLDGHQLIATWAANNSDNIKIDKASWQ